MTFQVSSTKAASALRWNFASAADTATVDWNEPPAGIRRRHHRRTQYAVWTATALQVAELALKGVLTARVLIADLVEILAIKFEAEFETVLALDSRRRCR